MVVDDDTLSLSSSSSEDEDANRQPSTPRSAAGGSRSPTSQQRSGSSRNSHPVPRTRTALLANQKTQLMALWGETHFPSSTQRHELSVSISLPPRKVQVWFQNMRQKARRAERDAAAGQPSTTGPTGPVTSQPSTSPIPGRRATVPVVASRPAAAPPARAAVLPSISSFMLSHAPAPTLMLNSAPRWGSMTGPTAYPPLTVDLAPSPRSPGSLPSVLENSQIGPPARIDIRFDPRPPAATNSSLPTAPFAELLPPRAQSVGGAAAIPFDRSDSSSSGSSLQTVGSVGGQYTPSYSRADSDGFPQRSAVASSPSAGIRLPSFKDLIHASELSPAGLSSSPSPSSYSGGTHSGYTWSSAASQPASVYGDANPPVSLPMAHRQPVVHQPTPGLVSPSATFASPPSPRSSHAHPVPAMSELSFQTGSVPVQSTYPKPYGAASTPKTEDRNVQGWPFTDNAAPRSASFSGADMPRFGPRQIVRPPGHLEVVGTGGKAGLGRWSISGGRA